MGRQRHHGLTVSKAEQLDRLVVRLQDLADDCRQPSRSIERAEKLIDRGEHIAAEVRAAMRGGSQ